MRVIDFHTHVYPDFIAGKAADTIRSFYSLGDDSMNGTVTDLLAHADRAGISEFVLLPVAVKPEGTRHINDFILGQLETQPRFYGFGTIHAAMENLTDEVEYIIDKGLRGVKMHPDFQVFPIDDPRLFPAYEQLQGRLPVLFHMGDQRYDHSHPRRLRQVLELFPKLQVIAAHFGGYTMHETACQELKHTDCFFDISSSLMFMDECVAEIYINPYGAERLVYGSDYPMWNPERELQRFLRLKLTDAQFQQIAWKTAAQILHLP